MLRLTRTTAALIALLAIMPVRAQSMDPVAASSLMIIDPAVIGDATTPPKRDVWTFKHLIDQMRGGEDAGRFVVAWLRQFTETKRINGLDVAARGAFRSSFIDLWKHRDGLPAGATDEEWAGQLKLENAPLRLSAIAYRPDLFKGKLENGCLRDVQSAGEGRLIFQAVDAAGGPQPFTVIFEYGLVADEPSSLIEWAKRWHKLASLTAGSDAYLDELAAITRGFTDANPALERPNNVALNQLRTNEFFGPPWELREFKLGAGGGLSMDTVKVNAELSFDGKDSLVRFLNDLAARDPQASKPLVIPSIWEGEPFLAGSAIAQSPAFKWTANGADPAALARMSLSSCNGCHTGETGTLFIHVDLGAVAARLSDFLVGDGQPVDCSGPPRAGAGDLEARQCLMIALATATEDALDCARPSTLDSIGTGPVVMSLPGTVSATEATGFNLTDFMANRVDRVH